MLGENTTDTLDKGPKKSGFFQNILQQNLMANPIKCKVTWSSYSGALEKWSPPFWHQGPVLWKTRVWGTVWEESRALHLLCTLFFVPIIITSAPPQIIRHYIPEVVEPWFREWEWDIQTKIWVKSIQDGGKNKCQPPWDGASLDLESRGIIGWGGLAEGALNSKEEHLVS